MSKRIYLYIDTSAFRSISFNLNHPSMKIIKKAVDDTLIVILTNTILEGEIAAHCAQAIEDEKAKINSTGILDSFFHVGLDKVRSAVEDGNVDLFQKTFRYDFSPRNIDKDIDWRIIFKKYFNKLPPFTDKKKSEFPDAFVIEMLKAYLNKNLHIISGDNDFHTWAEQENSITAHRSIKAFAEAFEKSISDCQRFLEIYKSRKNAITGQVKAYVKRRYSTSSHFLSDGMYSEVKDAYVESVTMSDMTIISLNKNENAMDIGYRAKGILSVDIASGEGYHIIRYSKRVRAEFTGVVKLVFDYSLPNIKNYKFLKTFISIGHLDMSYDLEDPTDIQANEDLIYRNFQEAEVDEKKPTTHKRRAPRGQKFLLNNL